MMNGGRKTKKSLKKRQTRSATGLPKSLFATTYDDGAFDFFRRFVLPYTTHTSRHFGAGYPNAAPTPTR
jgi:hypothetical protein